MYRFKLYCLLLWLTVFLLGCTTVKGYNESIDLPKDRLATIKLKAPIGSFFPLLWIFPFNMINWIARDWRKTSQSTIVLKTDALKNINMTRFNDVLVLPGQHKLIMQNSKFFSSEPTGLEECVFTEEKCTTKKKKDDSEAITTTCEDEYDCTTPVYIKTSIKHCSLKFNAKPKQVYKAFVHNRTLVIQSKNNQFKKTAECNSSIEGHNDTDPRTITENPRTTNEEPEC